MRRASDHFHIRANGDLIRDQFHGRVGMILSGHHRLAKSNPGNAGWQRDLAVSYAMLAGVYRQSNDRDNALAALRQAQAIMAGLVKLSPGHAGWKDDLAWFDQQIAAPME